MTVSRWRALRLGVVLLSGLLMAGLVAGCGSDEDEPRRDVGAKDGGVDQRRFDGANIPDGGADAVADAAQDQTLGDGALPDAPVKDDATTPDLAVDMLVADTLSPDLGPCGVCPGTERCLGNACSCVSALAGNHVLRTDGTVVDYAPSTPEVIVVDATSQPLNQVTEIYSAQHHGCALRSDGTVWCWALSATLGNNVGQLGKGSVGGTQQLRRATQVLLPPPTSGGTAPPLTGVAHISGGSSRCYLASNTCAVLTSGGLTCWGTPDASGGGGGSLFNDGATGPRAYATAILGAAATPLSGVEQVSVGSRHACVLRNGGEVWCWGANIGGPLGQGDQTARTYPVKVTLPGAAAEVGAGADFSCARVGASVYCWGASGAGQIGIGNPSQTTDGCINFCKLSPAQVLTAAATPLTGIVELEVSYQGGCGRRADGSLACWGTGAGYFAGPLSIAAKQVNGVVELSTCSSAPLTSSLRYLDQSDQLRHGASVITQVCP